MVIFLIILTRLALIFVAIKKSHSWTSSTREIFIATKIQQYPIQTMSAAPVKLARNGAWRCHAGG
jgi:hypothetical protein